ncbi:MAG TPA: hypothetical protein VF921_18115 [Vicinamibacterales bacterium]
MSLQQANQPIMVRVVEQPVHEATISDVIFGSIGLVAILLLAALLLGALLGGGLILVKRLTARDGLDVKRDAETLRVTPTS